MASVETALSWKYGAGGRKSSNRGGEKLTVWKKKSRVRYSILGREGRRKSQLLKETSKRRKAKDLVVSNTEGLRRK